MPFIASEQDKKKYEPCHAVTPFRTKSKDFGRSLLQANIGKWIINMFRDATFYGSFFTLKGRQRRQKRNTLFPAGHSVSFATARVSCKMFLWLRIEDVDFAGEELA